MRDAQSRRLFIAASALAAAAAPAVASAAQPATAPAAATFDRAAFEARVRLPFRHRQAFASRRVDDGAVLGFMYNSLNAYEQGFGEGPGTLHAAAVLYSTGVALAVDDEAWQSYRIAEAIRQAGDRVSAPDAGNRNPFVHGPRGWMIAELQARHVDFFVCANALNDLARRTGAAVETLRAHLLPGMMVVPAGVAAMNALLEERFTAFQASA